MTGEIDPMPGVSSDDVEERLQRCLSGFSGEKTKPTTIMMMMNAVRETLAGMASEGTIESPAVPCRIAVDDGGWVWLAVGARAVNEQEEAERAAVRLRAFWLRGASGLASLPDD